MISAHDVTLREYELICCFLEGRRIYEERHPEKPGPKSDKNFDDDDISKLPGFVSAQDIPYSKDYEE